jgi:hypothetical protein
MQMKNQNPAQYEWGPFPFRDGEFIRRISHKDTKGTKSTKKKEEDE